MSLLGVVVDEFLDVGLDELQFGEDFGLFVLAVGVSDSPL
jgi:hypothetical protein